MRKFSRKWEKMIAYFANAILTLLTSIALFFGYFGDTKVLVDLPGVQEGVSNISRYFYQVKPDLVDISFNIDQVAELLQLFLKFYSVFLLLMLLLAVVASVTIETRVASITLFISVAISIYAISLGKLWFISLAYLVVAFLLIVRKNKRRVIRNLYVKQTSSRTQA